MRGIMFEEVPAEPVLTAEDRAIEAAREAGRGKAAGMLGAMQEAMAEIAEAGALAAIAELKRLGKL